MSIQSSEESLTRASTLLKAMSNPHRLLILSHLAGDEKCVGELETIIGLSQSALSQHLARLRRDELVQTRRQAQTIFYSLKGEEAATILGTVEKFYATQPQLVEDRRAAVA